MASVRSTAKQLAERGLRWSGLTWLGRRRRREQILLLAYHNIVPHGEHAAGDRSLHLPQRLFADQLDALLETHDVVALADVLANPSARSAHGRPRPRVVLTFDDAYAGAVTAGVEELRARGLPATIFVTPAYLGGHAFWWDRLTPPDRDGLDATLRETALTAHAGRGTDIVPWAVANGARDYDVPAHATGASDAQLHAAMTHDALTLGAHTWSHVNLAAVPDDERARELATPRAWLGAWLREHGHDTARGVDAITYPYGRASAATWTAARDAGYAAGLMIDGGWLTSDTSDRYALPRLNVPAGVSADGFAARAAGVVAH